MSIFIDGARAFYKEIAAHPEMTAFYAEQEKGQKPKGLFITCSDSRFIPSKLTKTKEGEIFLHSNPGNVVPVFKSPETAGEAWSAVEFGIVWLEIKDIFIVAHTSCGAMGALIGGKDMSRSPSTGHSVMHAELVKKALVDNYAEPLIDANRQTTAAAENALLQVDHLYSNPLVKERVDRGDLRLHAWLYSIGTGDLLIFEPRLKQFRSVNNQPKTFPDRKAGAYVPRFGNLEEVSELWPQNA